MQLKKKMERTLLFFLSFQHITTLLPVLTALKNALKKEALQCTISFSIDV
ncbi:MAG: hypothetical protein ACTSVI_07360 [Promethearchaeota archaeon]